MRVAILAAASAVHTMRWVNGLAGRGLDVHLISIHEPLRDIDQRVRTHRLDWPAPAGYLLAGSALRRLLREIAPDVLNAHYATGYGTIARASRFKPLLLSVWGSDVYDFPARTPLHRMLVQANLRAATAIASTSHCMASRVTSLDPGLRVYITPFGVDEQIFTQEPGERDSESIVVGTVKTMSPKYGIDVLIDAFALAASGGDAAARLRLEITGGGPDEASLQRRVDRLGLSDRVVFHGAVAHHDVPRMLHRLDIFAALSRDDSESFGVAAVEAAACGKPVVVSDVEGLAEVTRDGVTGIVVPRENPTAAAQAILRLAADPALRAGMGRAGREHVLQHYTWEHSLECMIDAYRAVVELRPVDSL